MPSVQPVCTEGSRKRGMNENDLALRNLTYARFVELGRAPTVAEIAAVAGRGRAEILAGWERLQPALPLSGPRGPLVGRHCLYLKRDESLPVGRAHRPLAGRARAGRDDPRGEAKRTVACLVGRSPLPWLAAAYPGRQPGDSRPARAHRGLLAPS